MIFANIVGATIGEGIMSDLIERQTVIDALDHVINNGAKNKYFDGHFITAEAMKEYILSLQSTQPESPCTDCQEFDCYGCKFRRTT